MSSSVSHAGARTHSEVPQVSQIYFSDEAALCTAPVLLVVGSWHRSESDLLTDSL